MDKEQVTEIAFEIIAFAGEARSNLLMAIEEAKQSRYSKAEELVKQAETAINETHHSQTELLKAEAKGTSVEIPLVMMHAQDHLMNTMLLKDMAKHIIELYQITNK